MTREARQGRARIACARHPGDDGSASALVVALIAITMLVVVSVGLIGAVGAGRARAGAAADAAALAAAGVALSGTGGPGCAAARRVAAANGATVLHCRADHDDAVVVVAVALTGPWPAILRQPPGAGWYAHATARAGAPSFVVDPP